MNVMCLRGIKMNNAVLSVSSQRLSQSPVSVPANRKWIEPPVAMPVAQGTQPMSAPHPTRVLLSALFTSLEQGNFYAAHYQLLELPPGAINAVRDAYGTTLLMDVVSRIAKPEHALKVILSGGADASLMDAFGVDALMMLLSRKDNTSKALKVLIRAGQDLNRRNNNGQTAMHLLFQREREMLRQLVPLMLRTDASSLFIADNDGIYPAHLAARLTDGVMNLAVMVASCKKSQRFHLLSAENHVRGHNLGNAAVAALLFNPSAKGTTNIVALLTTLGVCPKAAENVACMYEGLEPRPVRSHSDIKDCVDVAIAQVATERAMSPMFDGAKLPPNPVPSLPSPPRPRIAAKKKVTFAGLISTPQLKSHGKPWGERGVPRVALSISDELDALENAR
jgi:hypothetical protein